MLGKQSKIILMILGLCLLSLLIIGIGGFLYQQQAADTAVVKNETAKLATQKKTIETKLGPDDINIKYEEANLIKKKESLKILEKGLMDYQYIPKFLQYIQQMAQNTGNELISIAPGETKVIDFNNPLFKPAPKIGPEGVEIKSPAAPPSAVVKDPKKQYRSMPLTITMKGTYISNVKFINSLRKFPQIIYIRNFSLSPNEVDGKIVVSSVITASALIVPEQYKNSAQMQADNETSVDKNMDKTTVPASGKTLSDKKPAIAKPGGARQ